MLGPDAILKVKGTKCEECWKEADMLVWPNFHIHAVFDAVWFIKDMCSI